MLRSLISPIVILLLITVTILFTDLSLSQLQIAVLKRLLSIMLITAFACFIVGELTRNYSQVDKLWSIMPILYMGYISVVSNYNLRIVIMTVLVLIWGIRLTYNFGRKGGYHLLPWKGAEDYRWGILREVPFLRGRLRWGLFNLFFISLYQHIIILLFILPALKVLEANELKPRWIDALAVLFFLGFLFIESIADQQQYNFQKEKQSRMKSGITPTGDYAKGFLYTGLWRIVRHPNYSAEQGIWLIFYFFSVAATGEWFNWSVIGSLLLLLLFHGSSSLSEKISVNKYPEYQHYISNVPRFIPFGNFLSNKK